MRILSLNCQRGYQSGLENFLRQTLEGEGYDVLLLQEVDAAVLPFLDHRSYKLIRKYNDECEEESQLGIMYLRTHRLVQTGFKSFASMRNDPWRGYRHPSFGLLWAEIDIGGTPIRFGTVHLHSGVDSRARLAELTVAKQILLTHTPTPILFAGDCNAGYPGEASRMADLLAPEFAWLSKRGGPTLDSRYSENVPHLPNRIAAFLGFFGIKIPLWTDHAFASRDIAERYRIECRVLPDRVSDHSPVELVIEN